MTTSQARKEEVIRMYQEGKPVKTICFVLRMRPETLYKIIHENKIPLRQPPKPVDPKSKRFL